MNQKKEELPVQSYDLFFKLYTILVLHPGYVLFYQVSHMLFSLFSGLLSPILHLELVQISSFVKVPSNPCPFALCLRYGLFHKWEKLRLRLVTLPKVTQLLNGQTGIYLKQME